MRVEFRGFALILNKEIEMVRKFKKPSGFIFKTDSKVHSKEYIAQCVKSFEEVKDVAKKVVKKKGDK